MERVRRKRRESSLFCSDSLTDWLLQLIVGITILLSRKPMADLAYG